MSNPFVSTKEDLATFAKYMSDVKYTVSQLCIDFETTPQFLREILPPCFDMPDKPMGSVAIGKWRSNICGDFDCAIIDFACKYKGQVGSTMLQLYLAEDMPIFIGREAWGEAKKIGKTEIFPCGKDIYAYVSRGGTRIIEIDAEMTTDIAPFKEVAYGFEVNAQMDPYGKTLDNDPVLLTKRFNFTRLVKKEGAGKLILRGTQMDDLDKIPVVALGKAYYTEHRNNSEMVSADVLPDREAYVPFIYGQKYDNFCRYDRARSIEAF